ncbi:MAG: EAL domain-containing protein [Spirochaetia bacterium]|nr:EAL domain-containing protein [Spirochaetia bacterium]
MPSKKYKPTIDQESAIRIAQVRSIYDGFAAPIAANLLISLVLAKVQWKVVSPVLIYVWLSVQIIIIIGRLISIILYHRSVKLNESFWLTVFRTGIAISGVGWGLSAVLLFPGNNIPHQAFLALALAGMTAGAITVFTIDLVTVFLFSIPVMVTLALRLIIDGGEISMAMGFMVILFLFFTSLVARRTSHSTRENVILNFLEIQHENNLKQAQQIAKLGSFDWNPVTGELKWSDEHFRLWGLIPQSIIPDYEIFKQRIHPDDVKKVEEALQNALNGGQKYECTHRIVWPDGSEHFILGRGEVEFDNDKKPIRMIGTIQDITQQNLTEEALRRSETKFRALYNSTSDAVMLLTEKGFFDCNEATLQMFGCNTVEEFCTKHPADLSPPTQPDGSDSMTLANQLIAVAMEKGNLRFEWIHKMADVDITFPAEVLLSALELDGSKVLQAVVRDITERKWMEDLLRKQEREFRSLAENSPDNIIRYDTKCRAVYVNHAMQKTLETTASSIIGKQPVENQLNEIDNLDEYQSQLEYVLETGEPGDVEIKLLNSKKELRINHVFFVAERDDAGKITGALAFGRDITELKQQEALEEVRLQVFEKMATNTELSEILKIIILHMEKFRPDFLVSIMLVSEDGKHLNFEAAPSLADEYNQAVDGLEIADGVGSCGTAAWSGKTVIVEDIENHPFWLNYKDLALRYNLLSCWSEPILNSIGKIIGTFAVYRREKGTPGETDLKLIREAGYLSAVVIERKQAEKIIHNLAFFDPLTRLPNRRLLYDRLHHTFAASERNKRHGAILFIDLDKFKELNDTKGHDVGDLLLIEVAARLQSCVRADDTVARLGGDEFVVVLNDLSLDNEHAAVQAEIVAEKIREEINRPFTLKNYEYHSSPSIGITLFLGDDISSDELLKRADTAMYQAKKSGRNTSRFFDPANHAAMEVRIVFENDLRAALSKNQFKLYYQMQVDHTSKIIGAEVLLRWQHPERGMIPPVNFIPMAEETGLIIPVGYWVLETACKQLKTWESDPNTRDFQLAVNISARQFRQKDFIGQVQKILKMSGANPAKLKLELTESLLLSNVDEIIAKMLQLKDIGLHLSMDDFGTGYSSLSYLSQLPLDQLKIDKSFLKNMFINPADAVIVQTIIGLGKILLLDVIAEGVETVEQRDFLFENGCLFYQGYLFGIPIPLNEFEKILV